MVPVYQVVRDSMRPITAPGLHHDVKDALVLKNCAAKGGLGRKFRIAAAKTHSLGIV